MANVLSNIFFLVNKPFKYSNKSLVNNGFICSKPRIIDDLSSNKKNWDKQYIFALPFFLCTKVNYCKLLLLTICTYILFDE